jgi:hypothetical protein
MNSQETEAEYRIIKSRFDAGQIPLEEYNRLVNGLRYRDNTGTWWAINPADGNWLKWDGTGWVPGIALAAPQASQVPVIPPQPSLRIPSSRGSSVSDGVGVPVVPPSAATPPGVLETQLITWIGIGSVVSGVLAWGILPLYTYPVICVVVAVILGSFATYETRKMTGKVAYIAIVGMIIALLAVLLGFL